MTALLIQKAEPGMLLLEALQGCQRVVYPIQAALIGSDQVQDVAVLGKFSGQSLSRRQRVAMAAAPA
jgi:hypothetical protein